ncbi:MAG: P1 family peptidase, partial [Myxococcales bacterium]|nr:P1 family peptidase [Myxococcales bacterium]
VGGGTGMVSFGFKGGIGTSSRVLDPDEGSYTVGVLVMTNVGDCRDLRVDGLPVGRELVPFSTEARARYGSIIAVIATDAPLSSHQIARLCKRVGLGIGRVGSYAAHGSGEIVLGFSTANCIPRKAAARTFTLLSLVDDAMNPLYQAAIEATEEAVLNALFAGSTTTGHSGHVVPGLPVDELVSRWKDARG